MRRYRHNLQLEQQLKLTAYLAARPALEVICRFKQKLCDLLLKKHRDRKQCQALVPRFLRAISEFLTAGLPQLVQLGQTLDAWSQEIAAMWRLPGTMALPKVCTIKWSSLAGRRLMAERGDSNPR